MQTQVVAPEPCRVVILHNFRAAPWLHRQRVRTRVCVCVCARMYPPAEGPRSCRRRRCHAGRVQRLDFTCSAELLVAFASLRLHLDRTPRNALAVLKGKRCARRASHGHSLVSEAIGSRPSEGSGHRRFCCRNSCWVPRRWEPCSLLGLGRRLVVRLRLRPHRRKTPGDMPDKPCDYIKADAWGEGAEEAAAAAAAAEKVVPKTPKREPQPVGEESLRKTGKKNQREASSGSS